MLRQETLDQRQAYEAAGLAPPSDEPEPAPDPRAAAAVA
jgi:hypothetical protein